MDICKFIDSSNSENSENSDSKKSCKFKCGYGEYCYKHRRNHLIKDDMIDTDNFTGLSKDYLKSDLLYYHKNKMKNKYQTVSKNELFNEVKDYINSLKIYENQAFQKRIIFIQCIMRGKLVRIKNVNIKCNNDEDFYTYEDLKDIEYKYFYSYKDKSNIRWGFDIRSFDKLIQMRYPNPYTTEEIPLNIIEEVKNKIDILKLDSDYEDLTDSIVRDRKETIKQKIVDLFSFIEQSGYTCHVEWFTNLSVRRLKELYRQLEDIWNYRSQLSNQMKRNICPPNAEIFRTPMIEVMNYSCKEDLQELILHEVLKFTQAATDSDRKLGFMYFLIAFGMVSPQCYHAHIDWLSFMMIN
jgi:hypothetical protein|tara:strand:- start:60 stop:1118 length:1059 start_codon:yes stop_codon:yes gene_type:complete